ncbi:Heterokaryon incompatibility protein 6, OR allele 5 [Phlyctema vagabunda]|uniref:Heterokaryon incompatibility protein 6, OR allele 5 n=1 Tax=Phlyctema vagabunda TaxID=108571 RepID=A0ABR4P1S9_9HELO
MATSKTNGYGYQALQRSRNEIRLIKLLPIDGNEKFKSLPACHIFHASLHDQPNFVALSYVWGAATDLRVILVEDCSVRVTKNLYDAMMVLRPLKEDLVIWVDALCINQSDDEEKSWQVGLMADIYQKACKVLAWLGLAQSDDDLVLDYLNSLGAKAEACGMDNGFEPYQDVWQKLALQPREFRDLSRSNARIRTLAGTILMFPKDTLYSIFYSISGWHDHDDLLPIAGIKRFFTRPWWGRIWILQEITFPDNAEFLCGSKSITRRRCSAALGAYCALRSVLVTTFTNQPQTLTSYQLEIVSDLFQHRPTVMLSSWNIYRYSRFPLAALLRATCVGSINFHRHGPHHLESSDPRDKIFALLGLAADREELEKLGVFPNYSKTCKETYTTAMLVLLQQGHMSLLSFCQTPKIQSSLPSWVPDWSRSATDMLQDVENDHITTYPQFSASGVQSSHSKVTAIRRKGAIEGISVECHVYDQIFEAGSFPGRISSHEVPLEETSSWPVKWIVEILRLTYQERQLYVDFSDRLHAAARTSIGGVGYNQDTELVRVRDDRFTDAVVLLENGIKHIEGNHIKLGLQQLLKNRVHEDNLNSRTSILSRLGSEIIGKSLGRLPFITWKGHLVLGPEYAEAGDFVALIKGTQVPFILRRQSDGQYRLIGEAYVDGIMDGEAMENSKWRDVNLV